MNRSVKFALLGIILVLIVWNVVGYLIKRSYYNTSILHKKAYCYQTYWGPVNPVLIVMHESDIDSLVQYYQKIENGDSNPVFNFPPLSLPLDTCVYILEYSKDSVVAKVICFDNWGKEGTFVKGYVYAKTLHDIPPDRKKLE